MQLTTDEATSRRLGKVRQSDTKPELQVRRLLHDLGHRYRVRNADLPGSPDIANRKRSWVVFVHGCYWHHHAGCRRATVPKRNAHFWKAKFVANRERDRRVGARLRRLGFKVITVWECEADHPRPLERRLARALATRSDA